MTEKRSVHAQRLLKAFSQFRKLHWKPPHVSGLKPSEFMVLHTVKNALMDGIDGLMVSQISKRLNVARPTVTQLVNSLQQKDFLDKHSDDKDKRVVRITLSETGRKLTQKGSEDFYRRFEGLADYLGEKKSDELSELLGDVYNYFSQLKKNERIPHDKTT
jgi:DNA-binding MarR family transcriptional regulator